MFLSIEKMMQEARIARGDIEKQYMLYYRCAQLSKLIYKQNDFATFKAEVGLVLFSPFFVCFYNAFYLPCLSYGLFFFFAEFCSSSNILISPKELVRMVEHAKPKKTAVIVDFRKEKSELISYRNDHVITVITVPFELIVHGLIFTSLRNQLEVGQRPLLHRIGSCDLVVLMSDTGIELKNGEPVRGSPAHLLSMALYEYNHEHHPKSRPLFMDGGFDNWRDQYPVYTRCNGTLKRNEPRDQLDHMVNNYKKGIFVFFRSKYEKFTKYNSCIDPYCHPQLLKYGVAAVANCCRQISKVGIYRQNKMGTGGVISAVFSAMMDVIWSGQYTAIKPQRFLRLFASQVNACLADGHQHDASEFQLFLLDALHEDTNQVTKRVSFEQNYRGGSQIVNDAKDYERKSRLFACSPVNKIFNVNFINISICWFQLQTVSELSCSACGEQSATFEECSLITVELPMHTSRTSLQQCLSSHFSQTTLDGDSRWNCPRCRAPKRASRLTKLWSLPPVVVVHLKRFSIENGDYAKNTMPVDFDPTRLDLSEYLHENSPESSETYKLYAVTNHSGRLNSGHYTALVCHGTTGEWLRFDDESVSTSSNQVSPCRSTLL
uniref:ubiquitinyl hydrolase 1 n=1 Tax=Angiostrongylus cantonensis TaxID=6313 RepID=A0A0K0DEP3_ANGCA